MACPLDTKTWCGPRCMMLTCIGLMFLGMLITSISATIGGAPGEFNYNVDASPHWQLDVDQAMLDGIDTDLNHALDTELEVETTEPAAGEEAVTPQKYIVTAGEAGNGEALFDTGFSEQLTDQLEADTKLSEEQLGQLTNNQVKLLMDNDIIRLEGNDAWTDFVAEPNFNVDQVPGGKDAILFDPDSDYVKGSNVRDITNLTDVELKKLTYSQVQHIVNVQQLDNTFGTLDKIQNQIKVDATPENIDGMTVGWVTGGIGLAGILGTTIVSLATCTNAADKDKIAFSFIAAFAMLSFGVFALGFTSCVGAGGMWIGMTIAAFTFSAQGVYMGLNKGTQNSLRNNKAPNTLQLRRRLFSAASVLETMNASHHRRLAPLEKLLEIIESSKDDSLQKHINSQRN